MKSNETVSVIIPVYKVEDYLEKCVKSAINQTYKNLEIILVDDGSPDSCPQICDDLAKSDNRIHVIHKKNGGLSSARNAGLDIATGQWCYFIDSDDSIDAKAIETCVKYMKQYDVDCVVHSFVNIPEDESCISMAQSTENWLNERKKDTGLYDVPINISAEIPAVAWNKLYKTEIIKKYNCRFPEGLINEDEEFIWSYFVHCKKYYNINDCLYFYLRRTGSIMGQRNTSVKVLDILKIHMHIYDIVRKYKNIDEYKDALTQNYVQTARWLFPSVPVKYQKQFLRYVKDYIRTLNNDKSVRLLYKNLKHLRFANKMKSIWARCSHTVKHYRHVLYSHSKRGIKQILNAKINELSNTLKELQQKNDKQITELSNMLIVQKRGFENISTTLNAKIIELSNRLSIKKNKIKLHAFDLFLKQQRFDLIFKYLYIKNKDKNNQFFEDLYIESIRAFNNFHEENPSDGIPKESKKDFINSFNKLYANMKKNGFNNKLGVIPIGENGEILDGAHRLTSAAVLGLDIEVQQESRTHLWNYQFFQNQGLDPYYADYAAMEYVKLNHNAYIVNLQPVISTYFDWLVEQILEKYGFIYYKKNIDITLNGLINLKKLSYGSCWEKNCTWIGLPDDGFAGAVNHAKQSFGNNPLRVYVFVCDNLEKVLAAKKEIRALFDIGNYSVHINDTREEAIALAQTYFNENSLHMINNRPYLYEDKHFDEMIEELYKTSKDNDIDLDTVCGSGSTPLDIYGIRHSKDLDFLYCGQKTFDIKTETLANHDSELAYYPYSKQEIIINPKYHFYYHGVKFITLDILYKMKQKRHENPKDVNDCDLMKKFLQ